MPQCVKYPTLEGRITVLPGNFEVYLSDKGRNLWMSFIRKTAEWNNWRRTEQKMYAIQLQQEGNPTDISDKILLREAAFRHAEEAMFDLAQKWVNLGPAVPPVN